MSTALVRDLRQFGLSEWEARSYIALATKGSLTASALSSISKIPTSKVYEVLRNLQRKSLAALRASRPFRWCAIEPATALKSIIEARQTAVAALEAKTAELLSRLRPALTKEGSEIWMATGRRAFLDKAAEMFGRATSDICIVTARFTRTAAIDASLKAAADHGVKIRVVGTARLDKDSRSRAAWYMRNADVRMLFMEVHPVMVLIDGRETAIRIDSGEESDYIWSNRPALVMIMESFFENSWSRAKPLR
ncbi:MAG: helix-turn-helix domain-containing protein [Candidatus Aenigmatarchaeota archaeon]|nr:hypothetical protein [Candidatus Aenigmarchaeota archaeon]